MEIPATNALDRFFGKRFKNASGSQEGFFVLLAGHSYRCAFTFSFTLLSDICALPTNTQRLQGTVRIFGVAVLHIVHGTGHSCGH
jgi:hypothetical protein